MLPCLEVGCVPPRRDVARHDQQLRHSSRVVGDRRDDDVPPLGDAGGRPVEAFEAGSFSGESVVGSGLGRSAVLTVLDVLKAENLCE
jgi:hypothetical protein